MIRRPPRSTLSSSSAASDVYKRQINAEYGQRALVLWIVSPISTLTLILFSPPYHLHETILSPTEFSCHTTNTTSLPSPLSLHQISPNHFILFLYLKHFGFLLLSLFKFQDHHPEGGSVMTALSIHRIRPHTTQEVWYVDPYITCQI
eukprot:TRINITY_DN11913_c0_g1_i2.p1 TRINITY_DN11913_c0_g1~~TRINITY_DN11913_c0_g1_i2.p1  ORF type:complete len:147 (-),score=9.89 TRINITY_DN11913_c0_g1_i2:267-707(-)